MLWLKELPWIQLVVTLIATIFILFEQLRGEGKYRKVLLWLALLFLVASMMSTITEHITKSKADRERTADLIYIQKLSSPAYRLGFDFTLIPVDTAKTPELVMLIRMDINITQTDWAQTIGFYSLMNLLCKPDSGWRISYNEFISPPNSGPIFLEFDTSKTHLRFWLNDFGISWHKQVVWRPEKIADLAFLEIQIALMPNDPLYERSHSRPKRWCPIKQLDVYTNSWQQEDKLCSAFPYEYKYSWVVEFHPKSNILYLDSLGGNFRINPLGMRDNILKSLP